MLVVLVSHSITEHAGSGDGDEADHQPERCATKDWRGTHPICESHEGAEEGASCASERCQLPDVEVKSTGAQPFANEPCASEERNKDKDRHRLPSRRRIYENPATS